MTKKENDKQQIISVTDELLMELIDIQHKTYFLLREMAFQQYHGTLGRPDYFKELGGRLCASIRKPTAKKPVKRRTTKKKVVKK